MLRAFSTAGHVPAWHENAIPRSDLADQTFRHILRPLQPASELFLHPLRNDSQRVLHVDEVLHAGASQSGVACNNISQSLEPTHDRHVLPFLFNLSYDLLGPRHIFPRRLQLAFRFPHFLFGLVHRLLDREDVPLFPCYGHPCSVFRLVILGVHLHILSAAILDGRGRPEYTAQCYYDILMSLHAGKVSGSPTHSVLQCDIATPLLAESSHTLGVPSIRRQHEPRNTAVRALPVNVVVARCRHPFPSAPVEGHALHNLLQRIQLARGACEKEGISQFSPLNPVPPVHDSHVTAGLERAGRVLQKHLGHDSVVILDGQTESILSLL
mmetsp:Transcript_23321/g.48537  ORF Transcript_23321/g.48537 Transcript_23321/m.48537 type:complete len:325 (-) Transcript_23321:649-1623(-)